MIGSRSLRSRGRNLPFRHVSRTDAPRTPAERCREAGVAIVEASFCSLIFFMLVLGVFEIGMAMRDNLGLAHAVRSGARGLSASGDDMTADLYGMANLARDASAIPRGQIVRIVVYKPSGFGEKPSTLCRGGTPVPGVCNVYSAADLDKAIVQVEEEARALAENRAPDPTKIVFGCNSNSPDRHWCPGDRKVTRTGAGTDYVGVWMRIEHRWITPMFGSAKTLEDQSVIRLEPRSV